MCVSVFVGVIGLCGVVWRLAALSVLGPACCCSCVSCGVLACVTVTVCEREGKLNVKKAAGTWLKKLEKSLNRGPCTDLPNQIEPKVSISRRRGWWSHVTRAHTRTVTATVVGWAFADALQSITLAMMNPSFAHRRSNMLSLSMRRTRALALPIAAREVAGTC